MTTRAPGRICTGITTLGIVFLIFSCSLISVSAHTFTPNQSAKFISLVDQIKSALVPISQQDLSNHTEIKEQAQYARALLTQGVLKELNERNQRIGTELPQLLDSIGNARSQDWKNNVSILDNLLAEALTVRVEPDQLKNATIQVLALAEDINTILDEYNSAFNGSTTLIDTSNMNMSVDGNSMTNVTKESVKHINTYQRAVALTDIATDRFNTEIKGKSNITAAMDKVASGLEQLKNFVQSKESPTRVMGVVHGDIQSNLQSAFNLELTQIMDGSMVGMGRASMNNMNDSMGNSTQDHVMMNMS